VLLGLACAGSSYNNEGYFEARAPGAYGNPLPCMSLLSCFKK